MKYSILWVALISMGCTSPKTNKVNAYFDITSFTHQLIAQQSKNGSSVFVKNMVNNTTDERIEGNTDSLFWVTELTPLFNADINKPSLLDAYKVEEGVKEANSNLLKTIYSVLPKAKSKVKRIEIKYMGHLSEVRQIYVVMETDNPVYSSHQSIYVWINNLEGKLIIDSLKTEGFNKTILLKPMNYSTSIRVK